MEYTIQCRNKPRRLFIAAMMPHILAQLRLTDVPGMLMIAVDSTLEEEGLAQKFLGMYVVGIRTGQTLHAMGLSLAHEMVHVKQLQTGKLRIEDTAIFWNGKKFKKSTPYLEQPWELQAFARQEIVFRRAFELC